MDPLWKTYARPALAVLLGGYVLYLLVSVALDLEGSQWDFRTYYRAAEASARGENPYDQQVLGRDSDGTGTLRFVYPPLIAVLFRGLLLLDFQAAGRVWFALQIAALAGLGFLWRRFILGPGAGLLFALFCLLAYNSPLYIGLKSGNIELLEQLLVWLAFAMYLRGRVALFCIFLCAASLFKLTPLILLSALLFSDAPRRHRALALTLVAFVLVQAITWVAAPSLYRDFLSSAGKLEEWGLANPSSYAFVLEIFRTLFGEKAPLVPAAIPMLVYLAVVAGVLSVAWAALKRMHSRGRGDSGLVVLLVVCIAYILVLPRAKDYSYALLLPSTWWIMQQKQPVTSFTALFVLAILPTFTLPGLKDLVLVAWTYIPLFIAFATLAMYDLWTRSVVAVPVPPVGSPRP